MKLKAEILEYVDTPASWEGRPYQKRVLTVLDRGEAPRLRNTVDFSVTPDEAAKLPSHKSEELVGRVIELGITDIRQGDNGRVAMKGIIVGLIGGNGAPASAVKPGSVK